MEAALPVVAALSSSAAAAIESEDWSSLTAEEYLAWVHAQAASLPSVVRANLTEESVGVVSHVAYTQRADPIVDCSPDRLPCIDWERQMLADFSELRMEICDAPADRERRIPVPSLKDRRGWLKFALGYGASSTEAENGSLSSCGELLSEASPTEVITADSEALAQKLATEARVMRKRRHELAGSLGIDLFVDDAGVDGSEEEIHEDDPADWEAARENISSLVNSNVTTHKKETPSWSGIGLTPVKGLILQFDQVLVQRLFGYLVDFMDPAVPQRYQSSNDDEVDEVLLDTTLSMDHEEENSNAVMQIDGTNDDDIDLWPPIDETVGITSLLGQWLYALLSRLQKPLHRDTEASIRQLYRAVCRLRASLSEDHPEFSTKLATLNMLASISGEYFGQSDGGSSNPALLAAVAAAEARYHEFRSGGNVMNGKDLMAEFRAMAENRSDDEEYSEEEAVPLSRSCGELEDGELRSEDEDLDPPAKRQAS